MKSKIRVIKIIDKWTVVIRNTKDISENDTFLIYYLSDEDLIDPETKENLGKLEYLVGKVKAEHIQEKIVTLKAFELEKRLPTKRTISKNPLIGFFGAEETIYETADGTIKELAFSDNTDQIYYVRKINS